MTKILLCGCSGKMGHAVYNATLLRNDCEITAGVDIFQKELPYKTFTCFSDVNIDVDVIIDFSNPLILDDLLFFAKEKKIPCVICTTGFSENQVKQINKASKEIPVFYSGNMSLGINVLIELCKKATSVFSNQFDVEIIEKHHNTKIDAPSGTALMIADAIGEVLPDKQYVYDRHSYRKKRDKNEIGIHSVRGGNIVGEHEVIFAGHDEVVSIKHEAFSKDVFAVGAVNAAIFIKDKQPSMYQMSDMLK